jgi:hypothetical protein
MKAYFTFLLLVIVNTLMAQKSITGIVKSKETKLPLSGATLFISNTTNRSIANNIGEFTLGNLSKGKYDLVCTFIGYETYHTSITIADENASIEIFLTQKITELQEVLVENFDKDGWNKWGFFFLQNFIGSSSIAKECTLKNTEQIKFIRSTKNNTLRVIALEPLIIINKALGYKIEFDLESFEFNYNTNELVFKGFPSFIEMNPKNSKQQKRWERERENVYEGSIMHFMRSLYRNKLAENGFEIRQIELVKRKNKNTDSAIYDEVVHREILPSDSIAFKIDNTTAGFEFKDLLQITYTEKYAPSEYPGNNRNTFNRMYSPSYPISKLKMKSQNPIAIFSNGSFYDIGSLISYDYWAWSEKISTMLPYNYKPMIKK